MTIQEIGSIGELLGAIGVLVTLIFLTLQLNQSTKATKAGTIAGISESISHYLLVSAQSPELSIIWEKVEANGYEALSIAEEFQIRGFNAALINSFQNAYDQMKLGTLTFEQWLPYRGLLIGLLNQRPNRDFWENYKGFYKDDFVQDVEIDL